jgi:predicted nuclease of predicted toxin-antitoxin system
VAALYANENFPQRVVHALRERGHDVLTTAEAGEAGRAETDEDVLAYAGHHDRAVLTLDRRDFIRLHQQNRDHDREAC